MTMLPPPLSLISLTARRHTRNADRTLEDYGLRLPGSEFEPAHGEKHRRRCLESLALFDGGQS